jgi:hypothetical protein
MRARSLLVGLLLAGAGLGPAFAGDLSLVVTEENDCFTSPFHNHTDRHYTQGLRFALLAGELQFTRTTGWLDQHLPRLGLQPQRVHFGLVLLAQHISTPGSIDQADPILDDRPYAGWLYSGLIFQRAGLTDGGVPTFENWELDLGMTGPPSLAEQAQSEVHRIRFPDNLPLGWNNQLPFEPGCELKYDRRWRLSLVTEASRWLDIIPHVGASLGNIRVHANAGIVARIGWNLPDDYGPSFLESTLSPAPPPANLLPFGFYLLAGVEGRAIARDLFLDGSTFQGSLRVDKNPLVGDLLLGVGVTLFRNLALSYTYIIRTEQFRDQVGPDHFASLNASATFVF